jgi:hypothetical protein
MPNEVIPSDHLEALQKRAVHLSGRLAIELSPNDARRAPVQRELEALKWVLRAFGQHGGAQ